MEQSQTMRLDQAADIKAAEAAVLDVAVDRFDVAATAHRDSTFVAGHTRAPLLHGRRLVPAAAFALAYRLGSGRVAVGRRRGIDANGAIGALAQRDDILLRGVFSVGQHSFGCGTV